MQNHGSRKWNGFEATKDIIKIVQDAVILVSAVREWHQLNNSVK